jgi:hypothetical protein
MKDEKGNPITYWGGLADEAFEKENEINKLSEGVYGKGVNQDYEEGFVDGFNKVKEDYEVVSSVREVHQYKLGLEDGYNKAKQTLYTKEQLMEVIELARLIDLLTLNSAVGTSAITCLLYPIPIVLIGA